MPREKNRTLRLIVPIVVLLAAIGVIASVFVTSTSNRPAAPAGQSATTPADERTADDAAEAVAQEADGDAVDSIAASAERQATPPVDEADEQAQPAVAPDEPVMTAREVEDEAPASPLDGLSVRRYGAPEGGLTPIGELGETSDYEFLIEFTPAGAGVEAIRLARHYETYKRVEPYVLQRRTMANGYTVASLAARAIVINGQALDLYTAGDGQSRWREIGPGTFEAVIVDADDDEVARIERRYSIFPGSFEIAVDQRIENLTDMPLTVRWFQYGPVDLPEGEVGYGGDKRRVRFGHLLNPSVDASQTLVEASSFRDRGSILKDIEQANEPVQLWPTESSRRANQSLVWAAMTNRYFAFAVHPKIDEAAFQNGQSIDKRFEQAEQVYGVALGRAPSRSLVMQLNSPEETLAPGATLRLDIAAYAGPLWRRTLATEDVYRALRLDRLVIYNFGGPCAFCTFQWLAKGLIAFLTVLHDYLVFDWALAIMILVV
ncbi:MAG: YidC/Oxa1 family insertase periplasmic-domain containing protein, partial [Planctomycetota bacterium]|nr:YidC/Oxa1 family insertase periplasmic-domain containing protein [Planctomycetota bacterium]